MQFDKFTYSDIDKISHLQPEGWPVITNAFRFYLGYDFCYPVKVMLDNEIVGLGNLIHFGQTAWLSHIIVGYDYRKQGIGFKIVDHLLAECKARGIKTSLLIATELGEPVYLKAGFRKVSDYCFFKREPHQAGNHSSENIQPYKEDFYKDIIQLDTYVSGENREMLIKDYLSKSFVFINHKDIEGFYIPGLGEGPIYALTPYAGRELMRFKYATADRAIIPGENQTAIEFVKEMGFTEAKTIGKRMILGSDIAWKPEMIYSRIGGNLG